MSKDDAEFLRELAAELPALYASQAALDGPEDAARLREIADALDSQVTEAGISFVGIIGGEAELELTVNEEKGSVFISRELWNEITSSWDRSLIKTLRETKAK